MNRRMSWRRNTPFVVNMLFGNDTPEMNNDLIVFFHLHGRLLHIKLISLIDLFLDFNGKGWGEKRAE